MVGHKARLDIGIHSAIYTADALHQTNRIPMDVVVDHPRCVLKVETFGEDVSRNENANFLPSFVYKRWRSRSIIVGGEALNDVGPIGLCCTVNLLSTFYTSLIELPLEVAS